MNIKTVSLKDYSSLRVGGTGKLVEVSSVEELKEVCMQAKSEGFRLHLIGGGTNSYFGEQLDEFLFVTIHLKGITYEEYGTECDVVAYASEVWDDLVLDTVSKGYRGIENLSYIPGSVGAAPVQNIGAYGTELKDVFVSCEVFDTQDFTVKTLYKDDCGFGYRDSIFKSELGRYVILSVKLHISKDKPFVLEYKPLTELKESAHIELIDVRNKVIDIRTKKLPDWKVYPNTGSFFKNPIVTKETVDSLRGIYPAIPVIETKEGYKIPSAWLIEYVAEMKGIKVGDLGTWEMQPLVIVNYGHATADDIDAFATQITRAIFEKTGIRLSQEVNRVG